MAASRSSVLPATPAAPPRGSRCIAARISGSCSAASAFSSGAAPRPTGVSAGPARPASRVAGSGLNRVSPPSAASIAPRSRLLTMIRSSPSGAMPFELLAGRGIASASSYRPAVSDQHDPPVRRRAKPSSANPFKIGTARGSPSSAEPSRLAFSLAAKLSPAEPPATAAPVHRPLRLTPPLQATVRHQLDGAEERSPYGDRPDPPARAGLSDLHILQRKPPLSSAARASLSLRCPCRAFPAIDRSSPA